ncbi:hypothetical protein FOZ60_003811 [Perkinsus olseni]|uniref:Uncharacterized protein n=1 Tax=Perkinsus olseni TaxID=32597 RepID=A0A7J6NVD1_PEROL|nr:hypothetical protein FOZ60_003811 [Perkinsus olseni]
MARQATLLLFAALTLPEASSSYQSASNSRNVSPDVPSRLNMTFYDHETRTETVIGYLDLPGSEKLVVTDVAHVEYNKGEDGCLEYTVVADEDVLRKYSALLGSESLTKITAKTPPSLRAQAMRKFGSQILGEYEKASSRDGTGLRTSATNVRDAKDWSAHYRIFLSRPEADKAWRLTALKARLTAADRRDCSFVKPKFSVDRLQELLTRSVQILPQTSKHEWMLPYRQLQAYSDYISPPGSSRSETDVWPGTLSEVLSLTCAPLFEIPIPNTVHWLTRETLKASP